MSSLFELAGFALAHLAAYHFAGIGGLEVAGAIDMLVLAQATDGLSARTLVGRLRSRRPQQ